ncbi:hypothetical protein COV13_04465 [Candidatus Woesearchaeota archaeon CG10_big_fil_rev_8_21_14_0_10_32_9]|nr:MAG: hypothetical protein COV13_04465 [Candidatus Woesearchaeota archaeon CG10_big_fil_rev_8_21_14_0_10_32_9]
MPRDYDKNGVYEGEHWIVDLAHMYSYGVIPEGRSLPLDVDETMANCVPSSMAAYLKTTTAETLKYFPNWKQGKGIHTREVLQVFQNLDFPHIKKEYRKTVKTIGEICNEHGSGLAVFGFILPDGKWNNTDHMVVFDKNKFNNLLIYDVNAMDPDQYDIYIEGAWLTEKDWLKQISTFMYAAMGQAYEEMFLKHIIIPKHI